MAPNREELSSAFRPDGGDKATMSYAILGLLVVLLIGFFVVVWKAARDWRWYNIVAVCITMLLAMAFLFPTAGVLKSRKEWHKVKQELEVQAATVEAEHRLIKYGDPANPEVGEGVVVARSKIVQAWHRSGTQMAKFAVAKCGQQHHHVDQPRGCGTGSRRCSQRTCRCRRRRGPTSRTPAADTRESGCLRICRNPQ